MNAQRAANVIARVRNMASKQGAAYSSLPIRDLVDETLLFLRDELQSRQAQVLMTAERLNVHGDRVQLQQVLVNLIMNAIQAAEPGRAPSLRISAADCGGEVEIVVADDGPGLTAPPDSLFTSFYSTKPEGMGLGLPICRSIVEAHGGRIDAANLSGGGAAFTVRLPVSGAIPRSEATDRT
jgi:C4-dicarboxylate-specific signal transduction histidine kinase